MTTARVLEGKDFAWKTALVASSIFFYLPVGMTSDYTCSMHGSLLKRLTSCISLCAAFDYGRILLFRERLGGWKSDCALRWTRLLGFGEGIGPREYLLMAARMRLRARQCS